MPYGSTLPALFEDYYALPEDPRRQANRFGLGQAGLALLASAGSPNYAQSLAQALSAYQQGRSSEMDRFGDIAQKRALLERQLATLQRQQEAEERRRQESDYRLDEMDRKRRDEENERQFWLEQLPEEERPKYSLAPTSAIQAAAQPEGGDDLIREGNDGRYYRWDEASGSWSLMPGMPGKSAAAEGDPLVRQGPDGLYYERLGEGWKLIPGMPRPEEGGRQPGMFTASQWMEYLQDQNTREGTGRSFEEMAREAEQRAMGTYRDIPEPPPITEEFARRRSLAPPDAGRRTASPQGSDLLLRSGGGESQEQDDPEQIRSALPEAVRDTPGLTSRIAAELAAGKSRQKIIEDILDAARRAGKI